MSIKIETSSREFFGKQAIKKLNKQGFLPISISFAKNNSFHGTIPTAQALKILANPEVKTCVFEVVNEGKLVAKAVLRHVDYDSVSDAPLNLEFISISDRKSIDVEVPVKIIGKTQCDGIKKGGKLNVLNYNVKLICDVDAIPSNVSLDISDLKIGKNIKLSDVKFPKGISYLKDVTILGVLGKRQKDEEENAGKKEAA